MLLSRFFAILLLLPALHGRAQYVAEVTPPAKLITSFPFRQFTGGVIVISGWVNHAPDTLNFILDTGSGGISLDSATCDSLGLPLTASDRIVRGLGGYKPLIFAHDNTLMLPGLKIDSLDFHITNYEKISSVYGEKIDGIIGYSFFSKFIVRLDYDSMKVFVYGPGEYAYERGGRLLKPAAGHIPVLSVPIRNKKRVGGRYYFDTGAGLCLLVTRQFARDSALFRGRRRRKILYTEAQGLTGKMEMGLTTLRELRISGYVFRNVPVYLFDDVSNVTAYPYLGGLVGNDLLRRFNVTLNYPAREIYLKPNGHFHDRFDYSYTGLIMYFIDGRVVITDIIKGSPAARADFRPDDVIIAVNNDFSNNIQRYRELLKEAGTRARLIIRRKGELLEKTLPVKSILSR
ncbi:hypothetical protein GCM10023143_00640 [Compostibacter hankyongensis]|uniref:PDZ domain-containing protein n=2 Tax=Compostibacter hankyongensis TaxID=1007089 RepID=A0ABP8FBY3_9BACT